MPRIHGNEAGGYLRWHGRGHEGAGANDHSTLERPPIRPDRRRCQPVCRQPAGDGGRPLVDKGYGLAATPAQSRPLRRVWSGAGSWPLKTRTGGVVDDHDLAFHPRQPGRIQLGE
jgi:hypothetical protein